MSYENHRYVLMTVDPVHIGTGGMRLGRVDLSIVREPGTNLPKIPGTALHGAVRSYAAHRYGKPRCAGLGQTRDGRGGHCGRPTCPICYTFGYVGGEDTAQAHSGVVTLTDARILLFPVYSMVGPLWVTSPSTLEDFGAGSQTVDEGKAKWPKDLTSQQHLNLGWLMVEKEANLNVSNLNLPQKQAVRDRIVLISDKLFTHVVNSNLEVRTSVSLNPETGAAEEGALFTYEAIPRATFLWLDVIVDDHRGEFPNEERLKQWEQTLEDDDADAKKALLKSWRLLKPSDESDEQKLEEALQRAERWLREEKTQEQEQEKWRWKMSTMNGVEQTSGGIVAAGLEWAKDLGIGGMGTRGFGRVRKVAEV
ncbi:MAG: hypothetical protein KatS3mg131_1997 [Candidatus Tectimicrobiota bacterium]|nr:MAG: hypothetical protein KatS3mg131_1997 [Candidatus Tectomicrobia bacterium]